MAERGSIGAEEAPAEDVFTLDEDGRIPFDGKVPLLDPATAPKAVTSAPKCVPDSLTSNADLLHDMKLAMSAREVEDGEQYSLGDTFWQPANDDDPPGHGLEALALAIFNHYAKGVSYDPEKVRSGLVVSAPRFKSGFIGTAMAAVDTSIHDIGTLNSAAVSNVTNSSFFATRFTRRSTHLFARRCRFLVASCSRVRSGGLRL